jgi:phosphoserine phosphatase RsbU/P
MRAIFSQAHEIEQLITCTYTSDVASGNAARRLFPIACFGTGNAFDLGMECLRQVMTEQTQSFLTEALPKVLIADDQRDVLHALRLLLKHHGFEVHEAADPVEAIAAVRREEFDLVLLDMNYRLDTTSGREGLDLLSQIRATNASVPLLVMTAWANTEIAIESMRRGACDFVVKPWINQELVESVTRHAQRGAEARRRERRFAYEVEQVRDMFQRFVPGEVAGAPGAEIAASSENLETVGGDYFEVLHRGNKTAICVGDVIGKGFPAAFLLSSLHASVKPLLKTMPEPAEMCSRLNASICELDLNGRFISLVYAVLDRASRLFSYCNAGHNPPLLGRTEGVTQLSAGGRILGFNQSEYAAETIQLQTGDRLVFYTDGITEIRNPQGEEFGLSRLIESVARHHTLPATELKQELLSSARRHGNGRFEDDATVIVISIE